MESPLEAERTVVLKIFGRLKKQIQERVSHIELPLASIKGK